jgi:anti-sigma factor RsiW
MNSRDVELLSAYLDGQLSTSDSARLEARLKSDLELRAIMDDLRASRGVLRALPRRGAPRNFTLTPKMAGIKPPEPRSYPAFRLATVLAALLFLASVAVNGLAPVASAPVALQAAPAYGYGGGAGGCASCTTQAEITQAPVGAPASTQAAAPLAPLPFAAMAPTETPATQDNSRKLNAPNAEIAPQPAPPALGQASGNSAMAGKAASRQSETPVPLGWEIGLGALALIFGFAAGSVRLNSERNFRARWNKK